MKKGNLVLISILVFCPFIIFGSELIYERNISSFSHNDLTAEEFDELSRTYQLDNYMMTDIDVYETEQGLRYAMAWKKNRSKRDWMHYKLIFEHEFENLVKFLKSQNFRLADWEVYKVNGKNRYAAIFVKNLENYEWDYRFAQTKSSFQNFARYKFYKGYNLIDLEISSTDSGLKFASVWIKYPVQIQSKLFFDLKSDVSHQMIQRMIEQGWYVVNYEAYEEQDTMKTAVIIHRKNGFSGITQVDVSKQVFYNWCRMYKDMGYRLVDFETTKTAMGQLYTGAWVECDDRFEFRDKQAIDQVIQRYRMDNDLPGISVAIIKNGEMLYRRGFGYADVEAKKIAHGETVYLAASVSKVIGATLAVKLHDEGRLRNGQLVNLNLYNTTRSYLTNVRKSDNSLVTLPASHTHTLAQLYAHLGCIKHYDGPTPAIRQYDYAIDALTQIWDPDRALRSNCAINSELSHYSTHAHTYLAAVLEKVTGSTSARLVRSEIAEPYGLKTMRAQFETGNLISDYERAEPYISVGGFESVGESGFTYTYHNKVVSYENNSWKVFGGGIETSVVDLAFFGWKLLNGNIVSRTARDNILWRLVNSGVGCNSCPYGIGWVLNGSPDNLVAMHGGEWDGARSYIKIYKRDNLVIAIMSNRNEHRVRDVSDLANEIKGLL